PAPEPPPQLLHPARRLPSQDGPIPAPAEVTTTRLPRCPSAGAAPLERSSAHRNDCPLHLRPSSAGSGGLSVGSGRMPV
ncbi:hypothetical protein, partial [Streptomyces lonarensis]|uniref:hypothetical protein n=1 Tax=Streptomyces lonarensis TaxID=700599 RepID=UPI0030C760F5